MEPITKPQIQKLHCLYRDLGIDSKELLSTYTRGRTNSTAGLTKAEATELIQTLCDDGEAKRKIGSTIYALAYKAGIIYGETELDRQLNRVVLNGFLRERGTVKKDLEAMTLAELKQTHRQMIAVMKHNQQSNDNKAAKAATDKLLRELNIPTTNQLKTATI